MPTAAGLTHSTYHQGTANKVPVPPWWGGVDKIVSVV